MKFGQKVLTAAWVLSTFAALGQSAWPDPARFEKDIAAFEAQDKAAAPSPGGIVVTGSSSARMWHGTLAADLAPHRVLGRGFGGSNMNDLLHFAPRVILPYAPKAVVLYEGDNDIQSGMTPEEVRDAFKALVQLIHKNFPKARIYFLSIKPSPSRWAKWPEMAKANALIKAECAKGKRQIYVDVAAPMLNEKGETQADLYIEDKLHLSRKGYELWAGILKENLNKHEN